MELKDFEIGLEFWTPVEQHITIGPGGKLTYTPHRERWYCTDVGSRTVVAVRIDSNGTQPISPPYYDEEVVFDEYAIPRLELAKDA